MFGAVDDVVVVAEPDDALDAEGTTRDVAQQPRKLSGSPASMRTLLSALKPECFHERMFSTTSGPVLPRTSSRSLVPMKPVDYIASKMSDVET